MSTFLSASATPLLPSKKTIPQILRIHQHAQPHDVCLVVVHQAPVYCLEAIEGGVLTGSMMGVVKTHVDEDLQIQHDVLYKKKLYSMPLALEVRGDTLWIATSRMLLRGTCEGGEFRDVPTLIDDLATMDVSPDGSFVLVGGDSERVLLFKANGERVWQGTTHKYPCRVRLGHDTLTVACWDGVVNSLDVHALPDMFEHGSWMGPYASLEGYHTPGGMPAFDAMRLRDGRIAAVGVDGEQGFLGVWHEDTPEHITSLHTRAGLHAMDLSPDGKWLAIGGNDKTLTVLDTSTLSVKASLDVAGCVPDIDSFGVFSASVDYYEGSGACAVFSLEWSHDGSSIYIGTQSGAVLEWSPSL